MVVREIRYDRDEIATNTLSTTHGRTILLTI